MWSSIKRNLNRIFNTPLFGNINSKGDLYILWLKSIMLTQYIFTYYYFLVNIYVAPPTDSLIKSVVVSCAIMKIIILFLFFIVLIEIILKIIIPNVYSKFSSNVIRNTIVSIIGVFTILLFQFIIFWIYYGLMPNTSSLSSFKKEMIMQIFGITGNWVWFSPTLITIGYPILIKKRIQKLHFTESRMYINQYKKALVAIRIVIYLSLICILVIGLLDNTNRLWWTYGKISLCVDILMAAFVFVPCCFNIVELCISIYPAKSIYKIRIIVCNMRYKASKNGVNMDE